MLARALPISGSPEADEHLGDDSNGALARSGREWQALRGPAVDFVHIPAAVGSGEDRGV
jgi:hypothetical protein